jgi:hypothetical protein
VAVVRLLPPSPLSHINGVPVVHGRVNLATGWVSRFQLEYHVISLTSHSVRSACSNVLTKIRNAGTNFSSKVPGGPLTRDLGMERPFYVQVFANILSRKVWESIAVIF